MKKKILWIVLLLIPVLVFVVLNVVKPNKINEETIDSIQFVSLPSPPMYKMITRESDIKKIVSLINESKPRVRLFDFQKGWVAKIKIEGYKDIYFAYKNKMITGGITYEIEDRNFNEIIQLFNELDYQDFKY